MARFLHPDKVLADFQALFDSPTTTYFELGKFVSFHRIRILEALQAASSGKVPAFKVVADSSLADGSKT